MLPQPDLAGVCSEDRTSGGKAIDAWTVLMGGLAVGWYRVTDSREEKR